MEIWKGKHKNWKETRKRKDRESGKKEALKVNVRKNIYQIFELNEKEVNKLFSRFHKCLKTKNG